jgi:ABC-2 type transport system ATP-binding protein
MRALIHNPEVIFLDEPTSALDPGSAKTVRDYILQLKESKKIIIVCTHNLSEAEYLADRIAIIKNGKIIFLGKIDELNKLLQDVFSFKITYLPVQARQTGNLNSSFSSLQDEIKKFLNLYKLPIKFTSHKPGIIEFETKNKEITNPILIRFLVEKGVNIISCEQKYEGLEQAYLLFEGKGNVNNVNKEGKK